MTRRCRECDRPLRAPTPDGYGPTCRRRLATHHRTTARRRPAVTPTTGQLELEEHHVPTNPPDALVTLTRYTVSLLPNDDINHRYYALYVELTRRAVWVVHEGAGGYDPGGRWTPGISSGAEYQDVEDALGLARRLAPGLTINGITALEAYRRTHPAP